MAKNNKVAENTIALNRKASHEYFFETQYEAGIELMGWEVKSIRSGRINLKESYVLIKDAQAWIIGMHISPLASASTHVQTDPTRTRRLLLNRSELKRLVGASQQDGYTVVILSLYWKKQRIKAKIALAKGKQLHDKRASKKAQDWSREKGRIMKEAGR